MSARKLCLGLWLLFAAVVAWYACAGTLPRIAARMFEPAEQFEELAAASAQAGSRGNFVLAPESVAACGDYGPQYLDAAERCRAQLAQFWFDEQLPRWFKPCPITVKQGNLGAGGTTTFAFDRGEVFGWDMRIQGTPERILDSVIPHEVNHTIFASKFRRPLPRWIDEGAATLFEHPSERRRQLLMAKQVLSTGAPTVFRELDRMDYPADLYSVLNLYATGFALTEWLIAREGREKFVAFVADPESPSVKLPKHYGLGLADMEREWKVWIHDRTEETESPLHAIPAVEETTEAMKPAAGNRPKLYAFTETTCIPCIAWRVDWRCAPSFRRTVEKYFEVVEIKDAPESDPLRRKYHVDRFPTFVPENSNGLKIEGYGGPADLIDHLKPYMQAVPPGAAGGETAPEAPFVPEEPATPFQREIPAEPARKGSDDSAGALPGIVGAAAGKAAGGWLSGWLGLAIGGPIGAVAGLIGGRIVQRLVSRGTSRAVHHVEQRIEDRLHPAPAPQPAPSAPRVNPGPVVVETESRPLPPNVVHTSEFIPVEVNPNARAYVWAKRKLVERYPDAASAVEVLESLIKQFRDALAKGKEPL